MAAHLAQQVPQGVCQRRGAAEGPRVTNEVAEGSQRAVRRGGNAHLLVRRQRRQVPILWVPVLQATRMECLDH